MLTYSDLKTHLRIDHDEDDAYLTLLIAAAYEYVENYTGRIIDEATQTEYFDSFVTPLVLEKIPATSVTSVKYYDEDDNQQTLSSANYYVNLRDAIATIEPATDTDWPDTNDDPENVEVIYVAGYSTIPDSINHAVKLIVGSLYEQRENHITVVTINPIEMSAQLLLNPYRVFEV